jgi:hypothetical protein
MESIVSTFQSFGGRRMNYSPVATDESVLRSFEEVSIDTTDGYYGSPLVSQLRSFSMAKEYLTREYDSYDPADGVVSSTLDLYADGVCSRSDDGESRPYYLQGSSGINRATIEYLFDDCKVGESLWSWVRHICKYGEGFLVMEVNSKGVVKIRIEDDPTRFMYVQVGSVKTIFDTQLVHFVSNDLDGKDVSSSYAEKYGLKKIVVVPVILPSRTSRKGNVSITLQDQSVVDVRHITGSSILDPVLVTLRILRLIEDTILITRIDKSKTSRIYEVEVGNSPEKEVRGLTSKLRSALSNRETLDTVSGDFSKSRVSKLVNEVILPVRDGKGSVTVNELNSEFKIGDMEDLSYFQKKYHAGVKVPRIYLGYEEETPSGFGGDPLSKIDAKFSKASRRISACIEGSLNELKKAYFELKGITDGDDLRVVMFKDKTPEEIEYANSQDTLARAVGSIIDTLTNSDDSLSKSEVTKKVLKRMMPDMYEVVYGKSRSSKKSRNADLIGSRKGSEVTKLFDQEVKSAIDD